MGIIETVMEMLKKEIEQRQAIELLCTDMLVPEDHLLRKIDAAVDFTRIYDFVEKLYSEDNGRPSCDPVVIFKLDMIKHLFGIRSLRQTLRDAEVNAAYRWFLGYTMTQHLPHFATVSYAFRHRFTPEVIETIFHWILEEIAQAGYLEPAVVFVDGTHINANANLKKHVKKSIPKTAKRYQEQLLKEVDTDRENHGKKPLRKGDDDDHPKAAEEKNVIESTTDPDSGRIPSLPYKRPMTKKDNLPWYTYVYDEYYDCVLCPQYHVLSYSTTNREYKSKRYVCQNCPVREQCTQNQQCTKTVTRHIWQDYIEQAEDIRHSPIGKAAYAMRPQTIERVFADAKEKHAMRYTPYRGLTSVTSWVKLKFAALNLKKFAIHKWMQLLILLRFDVKKSLRSVCKVASLTA